MPVGNGNSSGIRGKPKKSSEDRIKQKRMKREQNVLLADPDSDDFFAYIVGYTAWGFHMEPRGKNWKRKKNEMVKTHDSGFG